MAPTMPSIPPSRATLLWHKPIRDNNRRLLWATIEVWNRGGLDNKGYVKVWKDGGHGSVRDSWLYHRIKRHPRLPSGSPAPGHRLVHKHNLVSVTKTQKKGWKIWAGVSTDSYILRWNEGFMMFPVSIKHFHFSSLINTLWYWLSAMLSTT